MPTIEIPVKGMTCRACEVRITRSLAAVPGGAWPQRSSARATRSTWQRLRPHLVFNLGRVVGFGLPGAAAGALGCSTSLYAPDLGIEPTTLHSGVNVLTFTPTHVGTLRYSCAMGMFGVTITVIKEPARS